MHILIIGCGQLSRMLALAGVRMGFRFSFIAEAGEDTVCVAGLGDIYVRRPGESIVSIFADTELPDVISFEKEQFDIGMLAGVDTQCGVYPSIDAIYAGQHRYRERQLLESLSIPVAPYQYNRPVTKAIQSLSLPVVVKSCSEGYDGKNQWRINSVEEAAHFDAEKLAAVRHDDDFIVEQWFPFEKELSIIAVRGLDGSIKYYPLTENQHQHGMLRASISQRDSQPGDLERQARAYITRVMERLNYVGVLAMECFVVNGELVVNELAPRVHNSGHWTQIGSVCCQFENHLRAITGMPLGSTENRVVGVAGMVNLIGAQKPSLDVVSGNSTMHWYNKSVRPGRKLGHINFIEKDSAALQSAMQLAMQKLVAAGDNATRV